MKFFARFLRRLANHFDPGPSQHMTIRVTAHTSQAQKALEDLAAAVQHLEGVTNRARETVLQARTTVEGRN